MTVVGHSPLRAQKAPHRALLVCLGAEPEGKEPRRKALQCFHGRPPAPCVTVRQPCGTFVSYQHVDELVALLVK